MRVVGVEDGGFTRQPFSLHTQKTFLVCAVFEGLTLAECLIEKITVDGLDATEKLLELLRNTSFDAIMLAGVSFAGFNVIDAKAAFETFSKPIAIFSATKPDNLAVKNALRKHFRDWHVRWKVFEKLGPIHRIETKPYRGSVYVEIVGAELEWIKRLLNAFTVLGKMPEPLRVARLIARGLTRTDTVSCKADW